VAGDQVDNRSVFEMAGRPTALSAAVRAVYDRPPVALSRFAHLAFEASDDPLARAIVTEAGQRLAHTLRCLFRPQVTGPIVVGGGVAAHHPEWVDQLRAQWASDGRHEVRVVRGGLAGAAVLALREAGLTVDQAVHDRVRRTVAACVAGVD
jgi:N-acetylglucosamine kinase-like BadF-type ATPase